MTKPFGHNGEHFKCSLLLVLCNRLVSCSFAALTLVVSIPASGRAELNACKLDMYLTAARATLTKTCRSKDNVCCRQPPS